MVDEGEARLSLCENVWPGKQLVPFWERDLGYVRCRPGFALQLKVAALAAVAAKGVLDNPPGFMGFAAREPLPSATPEEGVNTYYRDFWGKMSAHQMTLEESGSCTATRRRRTTKALKIAQVASLQRTVYSRLK